MINRQAEPEWAKAKHILETRGICGAQLQRYAADGLIRTSKIVRPGCRRGSRLFNLGDIDALIARSVEKVDQSPPNGREQAGSN